MTARPTTTHSNPPETTQFGRRGTFDNPAREKIPKFSRAFLKDCAAWLWGARPSAVSENSFFRAKNSKKSRASSVKDCTNEFRIAVKSSVNDFFNEAALSVQSRTWPCAAARHAAAGHAARSKTHAWLALRPQGPFVEVAGSFCIPGFRTEPPRCASMPKSAEHPRSS